MERNLPRRAQRRFDAVVWRAWSVVPSTNKFETCSSPMLYVIFAWYSRVYGIQIDPDALTVLFGCSEASLSLPYSIQQTIMLGTLIAKRIILTEWKTAVIPCFNRWLTEFVSLIHLERLRSNQQNSLVVFEYIWGPIIAHLDSV